MYRPHVLICGGTGCTSSGSPKVMEALKYETKRQGLEEEVAVVETGCHGLCVLGPIMIVYPDATFYFMVQINDIPEVVSERLLRDRMVTRFLYQETVSPAGDIEMLIGTDFYKEQHRIALRNCDITNPENIGEYIGMSGYQALGRVLTEMTPDDVTQTLLDAGFRGRGGTGFPAGLKWKLCKQNGAGQEYARYNADESSPDALVDRSVLEDDPHALLEAMAVMRYAIGSNRGYTYICAEYPITVKRLKVAIQQACEMELLDKNIFGTDLDFDIDLRLDTGTSACGEETTLVISVEGKRGRPRPRPPFPAQKGLFGRPNILNSIETYVNILQIILNGPEQFASMGTEKSKGTKVFALGGKVSNTGLVEVPVGTTPRTVIEGIGGEIPDGRRFKAVQIGGSSGGCIPAEHFDILTDYDSLIPIGSMMGSGGLVVMDEDDCMVDIARFFPEFTVEESCSKCAACRIGTKRMVEILTKITKDQAVMEDLDKLEKPYYYVKANSLYGPGQTTPNPILSTPHLFRDEYEVHIKEKHCPAGVYRVLLFFNVDCDKYRGRTLCARNCPAGAVVGSIRNLHVTDQNKRIECGACIERCKFGTIYKK